MMISSTWIFILLLRLNDGIVYGAENCSFPDVPANSELRGDVGRDQVFVEGQEVIYKCMEGFYVEGRITRTCERGKWTDVKFTCEELLCGYVEPPENGRVMSSISYSIGTFAEFECDEGFTLKGDGRYLCGIDGKWRFVRQARCDPIMCPPLRGIQHGSIFQDSSDGLRDNYMSIAEYTCDRGYRIFGKALVLTRKCQLNGQWSGPDPVCEEQVCEDINPYPGGRVFYTKRRLEKSQAILSCVDGYTMYPSQTKIVKCQETRSDEIKWSPEPSSCYKNLNVVIPDYCSSTSRKKKLTHMEGVSLRPNSKHEFYSLNRYLDVNSLWVKNDNGTFSPPLPQCVQERCITSRLANTEVYHLNNTKVTGKVDGDAAYIFSCKENYEFDVSGNTQVLNQTHVKRRCTLGEFKNVPTCIEKRCHLTNDKLKLNHFHKRVDHNTWVHVSCKSDNREMYSNVSRDYVNPFRTVCQYGKFNKEVNSLNCVPKRCKSKSLEHMEVVRSDGTLASGAVDSHHNYQFTCTKKYEFKENSQYLNINSVNRRCEFGEFLNLPKCVAKRCTLNNQDIDLFRQGSKETISTVVHGHQVEVGCKSATHQLFNTATSRYQDNFRTACQLGEFEENINLLSCVPKPCDSNLLDNTIVSFTNGTIVKGLLEGDRTYTLHCKQNYVFDMYKQAEYIERRCYNGVFKNVLNCIGRPCTLLYKDPNIHLEKAPDASALPNGSTVAHYAEVSMSCNGDYELFDNKVNKFLPSLLTSTCHFGQIDIPVCAEKRCSIDGTLDGHCYYRKPQDQCISKHVAYIRSDKKIHLQCKDNYTLVKVNDDANDDSNGIAVLNCKKGKLSSQYRCIAAPCDVPVILNANTNYTSPDIASGEHIVFTCKERHHIVDITGISKVWEGECQFGTIEDIPERCIPNDCRIPPVANGQFKLLDSQETLTEMVIAHDTKVQLECEDEFTVVNSANEIVNVTPTVQCDRGEFLNLYQCKRCKDRLSVPAVKEQNGTGSNSSTANDPLVDINIQKCDEYEDNVTEQQAESDEQGKGCTVSELPEYSKIQFLDDDGYEKSFPFDMKDGENVVAECKYTTLEYNDYENMIIGQNITCNDGMVSDLPVDCPDEPVEPDEKAYSVDPCKNFVLKNGQIKQTDIGKYELSCDSGYSLNTPIPTCNCTKGTILCLGKSSPECKADGCKIPLDIDTRLSVFEWKRSSRVHLSAGHILDDQKVVYLNCSQEAEQKYEPANRQFQCQHGKWIGQSRNNDWDFGNHGTFPVCREAICDPSCENGGVCVRDGQCSCKHMTGGNRCQNILCDASCIRNGGECVSPGKCGKCPEFRYGTNCEHERTCELPANAANHKDKRIKFFSGERIIADSMKCDPGYTLSSVNEMKCQDDGMWTDIIECLRTCVLSANAANHKDRRTIFKSGERISAASMKCDPGYTLSPVKEMVCQNDGTWTDIIECLRTNFKYLVRIQIADKRYAGTDENIYITIYGEQYSIGPFYMVKNIGRNELVEKEIRSTLVGPIQKVRVSKDSGIVSDNNALLLYVSIFIADSDDYYVFRNTRNHWLKESHPLEMFISDHPERCIHTYGDALSRSPKNAYIGVGQGVISRRECKQRCVTTQSMICKSVFFMFNKQESIPRRSEFGYCYLNSQDPNSAYFRNSYRSEILEKHVSYRRICRTV